MIYTVTRCCGHTETIETLPNVTHSLDSLEMLSARMCLACEEECRAWEAQNFAARVKEGA